MTNNDIFIIKNNIKQQLKNKYTSPLVIAGKPGTAKSTTMKNIAKELDMNIHIVSMPQCSLENLSGLPEEYRAPEFDKYNVMNLDTYATKWSVPELIANANMLAEEKDTVLLLDDISMVAPHLQAYFFQLLLDRRLGNYNLAKNVVILGTMNDSEEAGMQQLNSAVRNRLAILPVTFSFDYWYENFGKHLHYLVASFLKTKEHYIMEDETTTIEGYATARAWTAIAAELEGLSYDEAVKYANVIASTQVSKEASNSFAKHVAYIETINFKKVLDSKKVVDISTLPILEGIMYHYIPNFVENVEHVKYVIDLLDKNYKEESFIGYIVNELYIKYTNEEQELSEPLKLLLNTLINTKFDKEQYPSFTEKELKTARSLKLKHKDDILPIAAKYLF